MAGKYLVVAGNRNEFQIFIKRKCQELWAPGYNISMSNFVYVAGEDQLRGYSNPQGFFVGTWRERNDIEQILNILLVCMSDPTKGKAVIDIYSKWMKGKSK